MVDNIQDFDDSDVVMEPESSDETTDMEIDETEGNLQDKIKKLQKKLKECDEEKRNHLEELQRTKADFLNSKRRLEEQLQRDKERAKDSILEELLTLTDSFDAAVGNKEVWESIDENWRKGVEAIQSKLHAILTQNGVEEVNPEGQPFNPEAQEAVGNEEVSDDEQIDVVITVVQKGYKRGETVLRPARVIVGVK